MKIYDAGWNTDVNDWKIAKCKHKLISYLNPAWKTWIKTDAEIMLDSGAFTAYSQGEVIPLDEYCDFCKQHEDDFYRYINLDSIGDDKKSVENWLYMRDKGLNPIPVFHNGDSQESFDLYCKATDYIAFGGVASLRGQKNTIPWITHWFNKVPKGTKVHLLGLNNIKLMYQLPFESVDVTAFSGRYVYSLGVTTVQAANRVRSYRPKGRMNKERYHLCSQFNLRQMVEYERHVTEYWKNRPNT